MSSPDYSKVWSSGSSLTPYEFSDADYLKGWEVVGSVPPARTQFDAIQRNNDLKTKDLNDRVTVVETGTASSQRQASTAYQVNDIAYHSDLPTGWYLECTIAGTTGATDLEISTPVINDTVSDGTVTWTIRRMGSGNGGVDIGFIMPYAANGQIPNGCLECDGSAVSRTMFPDLFDAIGTTYGAGDGSTTFNLPDAYTAMRVFYASATAGTVVTEGLPNITGQTAFVFGNNGSSGKINDAASGAFQTTKRSGSNIYQNVANSSDNYYERDTFDASRSSAIYGASSHVQVNGITMRMLIKAFDGQTPDSALIDITQYSNELAGKADRSLSNLKAFHRDVVTTSGTYTAPATALYKITTKGGGGGGSGGYFNGLGYQGGGGGEGGTTFAYVSMTAGDTANVVVGAGGTGGTGNANGANGGDTSVTLSGNTYTAGGGGGGRPATAGVTSPSGVGGTGTINGCSGGTPCRLTVVGYGTNGGGAGGGASSYNASQAEAGTKGGGGAGGYTPPNSGTNTTGGNGGDGYVWFEYFATI